ncbi:hypothetical protein EDB92DRAFT_676345 [Lactarius akahatsu]|uniref:C2H2-type domain-containing protein n=1 Tax=Lactarius akahatsu TaxID=416441 RepID=A0AAD4L9W3_9AGAM|nr:hypothetical protein EDB92DRAFT_676345 [Lactarius akahatsu]
MFDDLWSSLESVEAYQPCFAPSPESFDKFLEENDSADVDAHISPDDPLHNLRGFTPPPGLASPSESTLTTQSSEGSATLDYSTMATCASSYPAPPFDNFASQLNAANPKHDMFSDLSALIDPLGPQLYPDFFHFQGIHVVQPQYDDGPYRPSAGVSPHVLSATFQSPPPPYPADPPVGAASTTEIRTMGPIREKYVCNHCGHRSARKHNLKTHMETHNPNRERPFVCPENDCGQPFTRKHDLKRHLESMHGGRAK